MLVLKFLKQTEDDIKDLDRTNEEGNRSMESYADPNMPVDPNSGMPVDQIADPTAKSKLRNEYG